MTKCHSLSLDSLYDINNPLTLSGFLTSVSHKIGSGTLYGNHYVSAWSLRDRRKKKKNRREKNMEGNNNLKTVKTEFVAEDDLDDILESKH